MCELDGQRLSKPVVAKDCQGKSVICSLETLRGRLKVAAGRQADPDISKASHVRELDRWAGIIEPETGFPVATLHQAALKAVSATTASAMFVLNRKFLPEPLSGQTWEMCIPPPVQEAKTASLCFALLYKWGLNNETHHCQQN